jgi:hypothetical protein
MLEHDRVMTTTTTTWNDFAGEAPELAALVRGRFEATGLGFLATLRTDGSPRISGIEPLVGPDQVTMGMMYGSLKALDLRRDPRCSLHAASIDKSVSEGDARISGHAVEHVDEDALARGRDQFTEATGQPPPDGPMHLFTIDITEVMFLQPARDHLVIRSWTPSRGEHRVERA